MGSAPDDVRSVMFLCRCRRQTTLHHLECFLKPPIRLLTRQPIRCDEVRISDGGDLIGSGFQQRRDLHFRSSETLGRSRSAAAGAKNYIQPRSDARSGGHITDDLSRDAFIGKLQDLADVLNGVAERYAGGRDGEVYQRGAELKPLLDATPDSRLCLQRADLRSDPF